jgi:glycogen debranching enzyme
LATFDLNPECLITIRPRAGTTQMSRGRTSLVTSIDGSVDRTRAVEGLYIYDTRVLAHYAWRMNSKVPDLSTSSNIEQFSWLGYFIQSPRDCEKSPIKECDPLEETIELRISRDVGEGMHEDVHLTNHTQIASSVVLELEFEFAFAAQSEVQNGRRQFGDLEISRSEPSPGVWELMAHYRAHHHYRHQGNEGVQHFDRGVRLRIENAGSAPKIGDSRISFEVKLAPHQEWHACLSWLAYVDGRLLPLTTRCQLMPGTEWNQMRDEYLRSATSFAVEPTPSLSAVVDRVLGRSTLDLEVLRLHDFEFREDHATSPGGIAVAAGIPTYQEVFGRDMEISACQAAVLSPEFMRGSLNILNPLAARRVNDWRDAQPGRLPHEMHTDPLSVLNYRPRSLYFGSVSTSFLFPILVTEFYHWTGDLHAVRKYADTAMGAIRWADTYSLDSTGFYRYQSRSEQGTKNQGWKDSNDAIVHEDGSLVDAPIGTCEMQGSMYAAKRQFSEVMFRLGHHSAARRLYNESEELKARFNQRFWMEDEGYVPLGVDARGNLIRSIASDAGQCILAGILDDERIERVAARMMREDLFSGWGIRTLSAEHPAYNPFSYHRGSVWPVTTAAFVMAFSRHGLHDAMNQLAKALFEAAKLFEHHRLPEVFGGHQRTREMPFPGLYARADFPQAWSASAPFTIVRAMLGINPYAPAHVLFLDPHLPDWLPEITVRNLRVGNAVTTLRFVRREGGSTEFEVLEQAGPLRVIRQPSPWSLTSGWAEHISEVMESFELHRAG